MIYKIPLVLIKKSGEVIPKWLTSNFQEPSNTQNILEDWKVRGVHKKDPPMIAETKYISTCIALDLHINLLHKLLRS